MDGAAFCLPADVAGLEIDPVGWTAHLGCGITVSVPLSMNGIDARVGFQLGEVSRGGVGCGFHICVCVCVRGRAWDLLSGLDPLCLCVALWA